VWGRLCSAVTGGARVWSNTPSRAESRACASHRCRVRCRGTLAARADSRAPRTACRTGGVRRLCRRSRYAAACARARACVRACVRVQPLRSVLSALACQGNWLIEPDELKLEDVIGVGSFGKVRPAAA
jgi:hypothetical protein